MSYGSISGLSSTSCDCVVLGGGIAGLAAGFAAGGSTIVLEQESCAGGLVQSTCIGGYWFDRVIHLLYFPDDETERRIRTVIGGALAPCPPEAWVETRSGRVRYPFQMHLAGLPAETVATCLRDLAEATFGPRGAPPANFEQQLLVTFGRGLCNEFLLPYNRKLWKRPLDSIAPGGHQWTITPPDFDAVLRGAREPESTYRTYHGSGFYPRPKPGASLRGMGVLSKALADRVSDLRLEHEVTRIDLRKRRVETSTPRGLASFHYGAACIGTLPLPRLIALCNPVPASLARASQELAWNRVRTVAVRVRGRRPLGTGLWRYDADPSVLWHRLVFMHAFDPASAPEDGWGLMAEITEPGAGVPMPSRELVKRVIEDLARTDLLAGAEVLSAHVMTCDPAYVVFTPDTETIVAQLRDFLEAHDILPVGRYARWEYSSMGQVIRDAVAVGAVVRSASVPERQMRSRG